MAILDDFLDRIELLNDDFMWYNYKNSPATIEQIEDYERSYGISFNEEVRTFLLSLGAVILEVEEKIWPRPQEYDVVPAWEFGYGMFIYGLSSDKDMLSWLTYDEKYKETASSGNGDYGQMFYKRSGNLYRAYINSEGIITVLENGTPTLPGLLTSLLKHTVTAEHFSVNPYHPHIPIRREVR